jgi:hypothetical protein
MTCRYGKNKIYNLSVKNVEAQKHYLLQKRNNVENQLVMVKW